LACPTTSLKEHEELLKILNGIAMKDQRCLNTRVQLKFYAIG